MVQYSATQVKYYHQLRLSVLLLTVCVCKLQDMSTVVCVVVIRLGYCYCITLFMNPSHSNSLSRHLVSIKGAGFIVNMVVIL